MPDQQVGVIDVFVSYAQKDLKTIKPIVQMLEQLGLLVWWDRKILNGRRWRAEIEDRIEAAENVLVIWTKASRRSDSVWGEAQVAADREKLLHICMEQVRPPLGFNERQYQDLSDWAGDAADPRFQTVLGSLNGRAKARLQQSAETVPAAGARQPGLQSRPPVTDPGGLPDAVAAAARRGDRAALEGNVAALAQALAVDDKVLPADKAIELLTALCHARAHEQVVAIAEQLSSSGDATIAVKCLYAQSLIDLGRVNPAIDMLMRAVEPLNIKDPQCAVAMGLLGRAYKQLYVDHKRRPRAAYAHRALCESVNCYADALGDQKPDQNIWIGINLIALQAMADRHGVDVKRHVDPARDARQLIEAIVSMPPEKVGPWEHATLGEAYVALEDWDHAAEYYGAFMAHPDTTAFHINSALRQLKEVWQLRPGHDGAGQLLLGLETRLASASGGALKFAPGEIAAHRRVASSDNLPVFDKVLDASTVSTQSAGDVLPETIVGDHKARPIVWMRMGLQRASSVGRVKVGYETIGTGFLVRGRDLAPKLGDEIFFLTNAHVVSGGRAGEGLQRIGMTGVNPAKVEQVRIAFDASAGSAVKDALACELVWESPVAELDAALLRFCPALTGVEPCPIAPLLPELKVAGYQNARRNSRVFVIGHPQGGELSISVEDCDLLDRGPKTQLGDDFKGIEFLHYRTPTEPGNSGSPVFEELGWSVIGLHHFGTGTRNGTILSLDGKSRRQANEGVSILSIKSALARDFA